MKLQNIFIKGILSTVILSAFFVSCSEDAMDLINKDRDHTQKVQSKFILADVITKTAFSNTGGDINTYLSTYVEHEVGVHNQLFNAEHRSGEPQNSSTFNNSWLNLYEALKNARIVIDQTSDEGPESKNKITRGIAQVLAAYNSALLADMFGDTPYSEAALINEDGLPKFMNPKVDKQQDIYKEVFALLDDAIQNLQGSDAQGAMGVYDLLYNGNAAKWTKFAYGLKARYTMRLLKQSSNQASDLNLVLDYVSKSFTSASEQAAFAIYDASNLNPLFDFQWSRDGLGASESISEKFIERNDPRLRRVFINADWVQVEGADDPEFFMAPNGNSEQIQYYYNTSAFVFSQTAPTLLLSYHEVLFLKAEALCRLNKANEAEPVLKEAIIAAMANTEIGVDAAMNAPAVLTYGGLEETTESISDEEAETYFDTTVKPLFTANPLKETMIQKYLAFFGASGESTECYNDIRRMKALGENFVELKNPNKFPLRLPYGGSDTVNNPNVKEIFGDGQYVYTEPVWWAGGTR